MTIEVEVFRFKDFGEWFWGGYLLSDGKIIDGIDARKTKREAVEATNALLKEVSA